MAHTESFSMAEVHSNLIDIRKAIFMTIVSNQEHPCLAGILSQVATISNFMIETIVEHNADGYTVNQQDLTTFLEAIDDIPLLTRILNLINLIISQGFTDPAQFEIPQRPTVTVRRTSSQTQGTERNSLRRPIAGTNSLQHLQNPPENPAA